MKAILIKEYGKPLINGEIPKPSPGIGQVLVRLNVTGICHTDLHQWKGDWPVARQIMDAYNVKVLGHEGIGIVEDVGPGVTSLKVGDRVGVPWMNSWCGRCENCLTGNSHWCQNVKYTSAHVNGTYAEYAVISEIAAPLIPKELSDIDAAPLMCGGVTAYGAVRKLVTEARIPAGKPIAILGAAGGLGHYAVQIAKAFGYKVVGIDVGYERVKFVEKLGADFALDATEAEKFIREKLGGVYASIVFTPRIKGYELGLRILRIPGVVIAVGVPPEAEGAIPITPFSTILGGVRIIPSIVGITHEFEELLKLAAEDKVKTYVSRITSFSAQEVNKIYEELESARYLGRAVIKIR
jgi:propanol-preferring alcohol dehydrogenase